MIGFDSLPDLLDRFWAVFWVHANSDTSVQIGLQEIGKTYSPEKYNDYRLTIKWLSNLQMPWLLIYDNADDPNLDLSFYLPASDRGLVIITSRNPNSAINSTLGSQMLREMQENEACDLLLKLVGRQDDASEALLVVRAVGYLALPITHAAAYLRKGLCTMREYPEKLAKKRSAVLNYQKDQGAASYPLDTYASLELSAAHIQSWAKTSSVAAHALQLLHIIAFWHFESISEEIFERSYIGVNANPFNASPLEMKLLSFIGANPALFTSVQPERDQMSFLLGYEFPKMKSFDDAASLSPTADTPGDLPFKQLPQNWDNQAIRETFALLSSYSLVSIENGSYESISVHPVIHMWMKDRMDNAQSRDAFFSAVWILGTSMYGITNHTVALYHRRISVHVNSCLNGHEDDFVEIAQKSSVVVKTSTRFSFNCERSGRKELAKKLLTRLYKATTDSKWGEEHRHTIQVMVDLSSLYHVKDSLKIAERCWGMAKRYLGDNDYWTHESMDRLGMIYLGLGDFQKSVQLLEMCFQSRRKAIGEKHLLTHLTASSLIAAYSELGEHEKVISFGEIAVKELRNLVGEEDEILFKPMSCLVNSYLNVGNVAQATKLAEDYLQLSKRLLGEGHRTTLRSKADMADCYFALGQISDAKDLLESVWDLQKTLLGEEHEDTVPIMGRLFRVYSKGFKSTEEVFRFGERYLEASKRTFGARHLNTLTCIQQIADFYHGLGKVEQGLELAKNCWKIRCAEFGKTNPNTIRLGKSIMFHECALLETYVEDIKYLFQTF